MEELRKAREMMRNSESRELQEPSGMSPFHGTRLSSVMDRMEREGYVVTRSVSSVLLSLMTQNFTSEAMEIMPALLSGKARGLAIRELKMVWLSNDIDGKTLLATAVHELAHVLTKGAPGVGRPEEARLDLQLQEAVAYAVMFNVSKAWGLGAEEQAVAGTLSYGISDWALTLVQAEVERITNEILGAAV